LSAKRNRARMWRWARPRSWMRPARGRCYSWRGCGCCRCDIDHTSHTNKAVQVAEVRVSASLVKSVLVNEPRIIENSSVTVHVIRRAELPIGCTRHTARDTVIIAAPGPPYCVAHGNVYCIRNKPQFVSQRAHRHIENLAAGQSPAASHL